jgi:CBS domain-containing protein
MKRGDIPGAYWATLTHPAATEELVKRVFGDIHMLSHLVGAANRADIRRLRALEEDNATLAAKLERQQRHLRDGFVERDATIRRLNAALARAMSRAEVPSADADDYMQIAKDAMADLDRRLSQEIGRRERLERRVETLQRSLRAAEHAGARAEQLCADIAAELESIETRIGSLLVADDDGRAKLDLSDATVLYVGGRPNQVPQFKALVERAGGIFLHHDGGIEDSPALLPGLISRAQWTLFPVDCVSHDAMGAVKRTCKRIDKRYLPLRTSSLTCLYSGLLELQQAIEPLPLD